MMNFIKLDKFKSKSSSILCDTGKKKEGANNKLITSPPKRDLSPGVDLTKQQKILEYRRRGGRPPRPSANVPLASTTAPQTTANGGGFGFGQTTVDWNMNQQNANKQKESHADCKKREAQLKQELENHVKYIEQQAVALQRMEQTITYQYAIIQQLSQQIEGGGAAQAGQTGQGGQDPLAQLTKQFEQMAGSGGMETPVKSERRAKRAPSGDQQQQQQWFK